MSGMYARVTVAEGVSSVVAETEPIVRVRVELVGRINALKDAWRVLHVLGIECPNEASAAAWEDQARAALRTLGIETRS